MPSSKLVAQGNTEEVDIGKDEEDADAFILQETITKVARQSVGEGGDVYEDEAEIVAEFQATRKTGAMVVETLESEREERPRAQLSISGPRATPTKKKTRA